MSAVLSRKILADLLETYGKVTASPNLSQMIDDFVAQTGQAGSPVHPSHVTDNLHYLREIGNFGAHTQRDTLENVVDVNANEALWTLEVVDTLFDYFIVGPEKDRQRRAEFDQKIAAAGRKPLK